MLPKLAAYWERSHTSLWFLPALMVVGAVVAAWLALIVDIDVKDLAARLVDQPGHRRGGGGAPLRAPRLADHHGWSTSASTRFARPPLPIPTC